MQVTEQDLRERYEALETEQLLELQAKGTLTETAARVLEQVLAERQVSPETRAALVSQIEKRVAAENEAVGLLASRGARLGAQLIDVVVVLAIWFLATFLAAAAVSLGALAVLIVGGLGIGASVAYLLLADGLPGGQSFGKRVLDIAVIDRHTRRPCTYGQSFLRNLLLSLLGLIDWVFIFGHAHQRLGDMAANTIVVRANRREAAAEVSGASGQQPV
jgi:uncharacterized RDD family membrane protein YckC